MTKNYANILHYNFVIKAIKRRGYSVAETLDNAAA